MQKLKQTIILCGKGSEVATLTFEKKHNSVFGTLKLFSEISKDNLVLGISNNDKEILKQNVSFSNGNTYTFKFNNNSDLEQIGCVLVAFENGKYEPVLWGKKHNVKDRVLAEFNEAYTQSLESNKTEVMSKNIEGLFEEEENLDSLIDEEINKIDDENDLDEGFNQNDLNELKNVSDDMDIEDKKDNIFVEENKKLGDFNGEQFFDLISEQIDDLFDNYPRVDALEELIPNSKWVKIDFENNGNDYVLGLIYDGFDLKYICYGVPGEFNSEPPKQLGECQWLPLDVKNPKDGYFVIYQDANTGEKIDVI